jgi:signal transduction histidine kinase
MKVSGGFIVFIFFVIIINPVFGGVKDSLDQKLSAKADTSKVKVLSDLCWEYRFISADTAIMFGEMALKLAEDLKFPKGIAQAFNDLGIIYMDKANYRKATKYFGEAMKLREQLNDLPGQASLYNKLGIIDQKQGRLKEALQNQIAALKMYEQLGQDKWIGYSLNNIAIIHQNLGNLEKSLKYHEKGLEYRVKMGDEAGEANSLSNMANVYAKMYDTTRAIAYYEKALAISRQLKNEEYISAILSNMGNIYMAKKEFKKALTFYSESLEIRERLGDNKGISSTLSRMGSLYTEIGRYQDAAMALNRALEISKKILVIEEELSALLGLAKLKALTNQTDSAIILMKLYIATNDSVYSERIKQQILDVQSQYETDKLEQDLEMVKQEKQFTEIKLIQRKTQLWLLVFIIISMTGAGIFLFYRHQQRQKAAADAEKIRQQEARMSAVFQAQEEERRRIAKELHDGVGQTLIALKMNYHKLSFKATSRDLAQDLKRLHTMLDNASAEVRTISHQMMPVELEQFGLVPAIENLLKMNFENAPLQYHFEHSGFDNRISDQIELALFRILQELVSNVIKHAQATFLNVQLIKLKTHVVLNVSDNGIGFDVDATEKNGIGLLNIASRIDAIKGHLNYESAPGTGTSVTIRIPLV